MFEGPVRLKDQVVQRDLSLLDRALGEAQVMAMSFERREEPVSGLKRGSPMPFTKAACKKDYDHDCYDCDDEDDDEDGEYENCDDKYEENESDNYRGRGEGYSDTNTGIWARTYT
ncbi:hypothetical protein EDD11_004208 [Mortierella claussenii]|nr:hypothetical protein EDD11_004208 [Mortierella claussenii]